MPRSATSYAIRRNGRRFVLGIEAGIRRAAMSHATALLLTILTVVIGITGSSSAALLPCSKPLLWFWDGKTCAKPLPLLSETPILIVFWAALAAFAVIFLLRELSSTAEAEDQRAKLLNTIQTMPPPDVMDAFAAGYETIIKFIAGSVLITHKTEADKKAAIDKGNVSYRHHSGSLSDAP